MSTSTDYKKILEESIVKDIEWHLEELDQLYGVRKEKISEKDIKNAGKIINTLTNNLDFKDNENLLVVLAETIETIKIKYPSFL